MPSRVYADSLARFMKANGTTWSQADEALKDKARAKAIRDAAEATYRDNNALSELVSRARIRDPKNALAKTAQVIIEGTLPFRKTPANILVRSFEYSPLGILDTAFKTAQLARGAGEVTANDIIDSASKALAGTSLVALGFVWAAMGVLKGKAPDDEKEKELWEMQGHQAYSLEIGGTSYTLDWLAPSSIPMFFGANLQEAMMAKGLTVEEATAAFGSLFDPILEMSMLQGTRSDTETKIKIQYDTDYETREDLTELYTWAWTWKNLDLGAQILGYYNLEAPRYAKVAKRRPGCRHIRHFSMTLSNDAVGEDLAIVSAQVFYRFQGKER